MRIAEVLVVAALAAAALPAAAQERHYVNMRLVLPEIKDASGGRALALAYGTARPDLGRHFFLEGEFTATATEAEKDESPPGQTLGIAYFTLGGYGVLTRRLDGGTELKGKLGVHYQDFERQAFVGEHVVATTDWDFGISAGAGLTHPVRDRIELMAEYTLFGSDFRFFSLGAQYRY